MAVYLCSEYGFGLAAPLPYMGLRCRDEETAGRALAPTSRLTGGLARTSRAVEDPPMTRGLFDLPWVVWAALAFVVAAVFAFVAPGSAGTTGLRYMVLRWFHPLAWVLLGSSALIRGFTTGGARSAADPAAQLGLVVYLAFLFTFVVTRRRQRAAPDG